MGEEILSPKPPPDMDHWLPIPPSVYRPRGFGKDAPHQEDHQHSSPRMQQMQHKNLIEEDYNVMPLNKEQAIITTPEWKANHRVR